MTAPSSIPGDHALLTNLGASWHVQISVGGRSYDYDFRLVDLTEDESPRDVAVKRIADLGYRVDGDGSWWVGAHVGPGADHTWAYLVPVVVPHGLDRGQVC